MKGTRVVRILSLWLRRVVLLAPIPLLLVASIPRFQGGLAVDAAFPVPVYAVLNVPLPATSYRAAADVLAKADSRDGPSLIARAEMASLAGNPPERVLDLLRDGLSRSPASVRGWSLLAEQLETQDRMQAGAALAHSLLLGPREYFIAGKRSRAAALLWDELPADARETALSQTRLLWTELVLHPEIGPMLTRSGGAELMKRAFQNDPEQLRALNRWLAEERRRAAAKQ